MIRFHETLCGNCGRPTAIAVGICQLCGSAISEKKLIVVKAGCIKERVEQSALSVVYAIGKAA